MAIKGSCLCGKTTVEVKGGPYDEQIACHCTDCAQTSGSSNSTNILPKKADVDMKGAIGTFKIKAPSGNFVERIFCKECGSAMGHKSVAFGDAMALQTGTMYQHFSKVPIKTELFVKDRWSGVPAIEGAAQVEAMP